MTLITLLEPLRRRLPKPGAWMVKFQQFLAFPMFATVIWLVFVLSVQSGLDAVLWALSGMLAIGFFAWIARTVSGDWKSLWGRAAGFGLALSFLAIPASFAAYGPAVRPAAAAGVVAPAGSLAFEAFSEQRLAGALAEDRMAFVNVTAAWCITCLSNERVVFTDEAVKDMFKTEKVLYLKADWTNRNEKIAKYLMSFGRAGVPLYVVYKPGQPPKVLPQLLTPGSVMASLKPVG